MFESKTIVLESSIINNLKFVNETIIGTLIDTKN